MIRKTLMSIKEEEEKSILKNKCKKSWTLRFRSIEEERWKYSHTHKKQKKNTK